MKLLVIRHAIAQERDVFSKSGKPDDLRPLTPKGRRRMARTAAGLRRLVPRIDVLVSSPLVRAQQTATVVAEEYGIPTGEATAVLAPGATMESFASWAAAQKGNEVIAVVGHEPHLSSLVTWLVSGLEDSRLELKKGGVCLLEFADAPARASATLLWLQTPRSLRQLAH
jgi:phosphohistidine phosphatase